jgi:guanine nucleotide-binding protein subunit alpha, other
MLTRVPGAGESGKSTILKQMRLIHNDGFTVHERKEIRQVIFSNMVVAFKVIAEEMRDLGLTYELEGTEVIEFPRVGSEHGLRWWQKYEQVLLQAEDIGVNDPFPLDCLPSMKGLWKDPAVQQTIKRGNEYALHDNIQ